MHEANWTLRTLHGLKFVGKPGPLWVHPDERGQHGGVTAVDSRYNFRIVGVRRAKDMNGVPENEASIEFRDDQMSIDALLGLRGSEEEKEEWDADY